MSSPRLIRCNILLTNLSKHIKYDMSTLFFIMGKKTEKKPPEQLKSGGNV